MIRFGQHLKNEENKDIKKTFLESGHGWMVFTRSKPTTTYGLMDNPTAYKRMKTLTKQP